MAHPSPSLTGSRPNANASYRYLLPKMRRIKRGASVETIFPACTCERADYHAPDRRGLGAQLGFCIKRCDTDTNADTDTHTNAYTNSDTNWYTDTHTYPHA